MTGRKPNRIEIDGHKIRYFIQKSPQARKYRITYLNDSLFRITYPRRGIIPDPEELLNRHRLWVLNRLREEQNMLSSPLEVKEGAEVPLLDTRWTLRIHTGVDSRTSWLVQPDTRTVFLSGRDKHQIHMALEQWYKRMAAEFISRQIPFWAARMKVSPSGFRIKNQRTIWGSCSHRGFLNFNWRALLLSEKAADYLIIHELAHLRHLNHSSQFWDLVSRHCPWYKDGKKELRTKNHWLLFCRTVESLKKFG